MEVELEVELVVVEEGGRKMEVRTRWIRWRWRYQVAAVNPT